MNKGLPLQLQMVATGAPVLETVWFVRAAEIVLQDRSSSVRFHFV